MKKVIAGMNCSVIIQSLLTTIGRMAISSFFGTRKPFIREPNQEVKTTITALVE